jgi:mono/diheme cytochrome c family protein
MRIAFPALQKHVAIALSTITFLSIFILSSADVFAQPDGKKLFKGQCASCHYPSEKKLIGPGLKGVKDRWSNYDNLKSWIRNSQNFLKTGDSYATALYAEYNQSVMPSFDLSDEEIDAILEYANTPPVVAATTTTDTASSGEAAKDDSGTLLYVLLAISILFIILISVLGGVNKSLKNLINQSNGLPNEIELPLPEAIKAWLSSNKKLTALIVVFLIVGGIRTGWNSLLGIGIYTGYAPEQPIKFSHKIHAGENGIDCQYCHSGVAQSKHSNIPSANVCMNCHLAIQEGPAHGTKEIGKIYAALDFDPVTGTYGNNPKPIKWIKVHQLPNHAFFSHAQHVTAGQLECENCHGDVKNMDVVEQVSPLTMGWCINCHRETQVKMEGSEYYDEIHSRLSDNLKEKFMKDGKITVDELGGLECAKCHY